MFQFSSSKKKRKISWGFSAFKEKENELKQPIELRQSNAIEEELQQQKQSTVVQLKKVSLFPFSYNTVFDSDRKSEIAPVYQSKNKTIIPPIQIQQEPKIEDLFRNFQKFLTNQENLIDQNKELIEFAMVTLRQRMIQEIEKLEGQIQEKSNQFEQSQYKPTIQMENIGEEPKNEDDNMEQGSKQIRQSVLDMLGFQLTGLKYIPNLQYELCFVYPMLKLSLNIRLIVGIRKNLNISRDSKDFEQKFIAFSQDLQQNNIQLQDIMVKALRMNYSQFNTTLILENYLKNQYHTINLAKLNELLNSVFQIRKQIDQIQLDLAYLENCWGCFWQVKQNELIIFFGIRMHLQKFLRNFKQLSQEEINQIIKHKMIMIISIKFSDLSLTIKEYQDIKMTLKLLIPEADFQMIQNNSVRRSLDQTFLEEDSIQEEIEDQSTQYQEQMQKLIKQIQFKYQKSNQLRQLIEEVSLK